MLLTQGFAPLAKNCRPVGAEVRGLAMFQPNDHILDYADDYLHDVLSAAETEYVEKHCESCRICKVALEEARKRQTAFETVPSCEASEPLIRATLARIEAGEQRRSRGRRLFARFLLPAAAAAALLLGGLHIHYANLTVSPADIRVLGQNQLLAGALGSLRIRVVDHFSGLAMANIPVRIELRGQGEKVELAKFTTDAQGTGQPRFRVPDWADGRY